MAEDFWSDPGGTISDWGTTAYNDANTWYSQNIAPSFGTADFSSAINDNYGVTSPVSDVSTMKWDSYSPPVDSSMNFAWNDPGWQGGYTDES